MNSNLQKDEQQASQSSGLSTDEYEARKSARPPSFWEWFFKGPSSQRAGWRFFLNRWLLLHISVGAIAANWLPISLKDASTTVLLPLAGVFVGMSFAWVGNAQAILQSREIGRLAEAGQTPYEDYVYFFQSAILTILVTLVAWGIAALGYFELPCAWPCAPFTYEIAGTTLFALASLSLRECWHVVLGAQILLVSQRFVSALGERKTRERREQAAEPTCKRDGG